MRIPVGLPIRPPGYRTPHSSVHTDECGKCPDEVDNQGNKAVLPGTALAWTLTTTSQSTLISSRNAHGQISNAGAWRTFEINWTSKTTTHTACSPTAKTRWLSTMRSETARSPESFLWNRRAVARADRATRAIWSRLSRSYSYDIAPRSPMRQIKNEAMAVTTPTADATTAPFFLSFSPTNRVAVK